MDPAAMGDKDWTDVVQTNPRDALRIENNKEKKHGRRKVLVGGGERKCCTFMIWFKSCL